MPGCIDCLQLVTVCLDPLFQSSRPHSIYIFATACKLWEAHEHTVGIIITAIRAPTTLPALLKLDIFQLLPKHLLLPLDRCFRSSWHKGHLICSSSSHPPATHAPPLEGLSALLVHACNCSVFHVECICILQTSLRVMYIRAASSGSYVAEPGPTYSYLGTAPERPSFGSMLISCNPGHFDLVICLSWMMMMMMKKAHCFATGCSNHAMCGHQRTPRF